MKKTIIEDLKSTYNITPLKFEPVSGGWMNEKWRVTAESGSFLVKEFSRKRFNGDKLQHIEMANKNQAILYEKGVPCPRIYMQSGNALRYLEDGTVYMVMDFCKGHTESPETINLPQLKSLGEACGFMHKCFAELPTQGVKGFPIKSQEIIDSLWRNLYTLKGEETGNEAFFKALTDEEQILKSLTRDFFERLPQGIGHEDFSWDNMLFLGDSISAIVDFDRSCYCHIWHDVGRALLSFCFTGNGMDIEKTETFMQGYTAHMARPNLADTLRLTWCVEAPWWIQPGMFKGQRESKVIRFRDEILWLTKNWNELDRLK